MKNVFDWLKPRTNDVPRYLVNFFRQNTPEYCLGLYVACNSRVLVHNYYSTVALDRAFSVVSNVIGSLPQLVQDFLWSRSFTPKDWQFIVINLHP